MFQKFEVTFGSNSFSRWFRDLIFWHYDRAMSQTFWQSFSLIRCLKPILQPKITSKNDSKRLHSKYNFLAFQGHFLVENWILQAKKHFFLVQQHFSEQKWPKFWPKLPFSRFPKVQRWNVGSRPKLDKYLHFLVW